MDNKKLFLFFEGSVTDKFFKGDHKLKKALKKLLGKQIHFSSGVDNWFLNLCEGLKQNGVKYSVNDYKNLRKAEAPLAVVIAPERILDKIPENIPIIYGPGICSHPSQLNWSKYNIKKLIIPCLWLAEMYKRDLPYPLPYSILPIGIRTDLWRDSENSVNDLILIYDKVRWEREHYEYNLINPIIEDLKFKFGNKVRIIKYGDYQEPVFMKLAKQASFMIFLCEHETQGFAYQQVLSCNVPILAWERAGFWKDPGFYPRIKFEPVSSVPYWDDSCGMKFFDFDDFKLKIDVFLNNVINKKYRPREFVLQNLSIKECATRFINAVNSTNYTE